MEEFEEHHENHDGSAAVTPAPPRKRNQYNLEFKLDVANQYAPGVPGRGFDALAREYGLSKSNVMHWVAKKELMAERLAAAGGSGAARNSFRLDGCGRKSVYGELEDELEQWVIMQTARGERVKDKDLQEKAMLIFREMHPDVSASSENSFKASSGWVARFKQRKNFSVRRGSKTAPGGDAEEDAARVAAATGYDAGGTEGVQMTPPPQQQRRTPQPRTATRPAPAAAATTAARHTATSATVAASTTAAPASAPTASATNVRKAAVAAAVASGVKRPAAAAAAATQTAQNPVATVDPGMRAVSVEWMQAVDQKFSELAQQISYLAEGQNLLLGMLQRMTPLVQPARGVAGMNGAAAVGSSPMHNGLFSPSVVPPSQPPSVVYETVAAAREEDAKQLPTPDVTPNKRRRASMLNSVV